MKIVMLGGTGAVGGEVLKALLARDDVGHVTALNRRMMETAHAKLRVQIVDVCEPFSYAQYLATHDAAICTLGVGQPSKVSREEFRQVDHDAVLAFATACRAASIAHFELLGSVASDPHSRNFYLKSKGELREAIAQLGFARFSCFQPSMLLTQTNRYGFSQGVMLAVWPILSPLLIGPLQKYRGVRVETLGTAMANNLFRTGIGTETHHWGDFTHLNNPQVPLADNQ